MITAVYLQNDSSISLEWSFLWNAGIVLFISYPNSTIPVFHWNDDNNKTLFSLYLLWPLMCSIKILFLVSFIIIFGLRSLSCLHKYMYTPQPNRAIGSTQWTNTFELRILKYSIKIVKNANLPNLLACRKKVPT